MSPRVVKMRPDPPDTLSTLWMQCLPMPGHERLAFIDRQGAYRDQLKAMSDELVYGRRTAVGAATTGNTQGTPAPSGVGAPISEDYEKDTNGAVSQVQQRGLGMVLSAFQKPHVEDIGTPAVRVDEGKPSPLPTALYALRDPLQPFKVRVVRIATAEAVKRDPQYVRTTRSSLLRGLTREEDHTFLDPSNSGSAGIKPASITYGASSRTVTQPVTGGDLDAALSDITTPGSGLVVFASQLTFARVEAALGRVEARGFLCGVPKIASANIGTLSTGSPRSDLLVFADMDQIAFHFGPLELSTAEEASVEMSDSPGQSGVSGSGASMVSLWQSGLVGYLLERTVNWAVLRSGAVSYLTIS